MKSRIADAILSRGTLAYATVGPDLRLTGIQGDPFLLFGSEGLAPSALVDAPLTQVAPELVGSEAQIQAVLTGQAPEYHLEMVNRQRPDGSIEYVSITLLPLRDETGRPQGLLYLVENVTQQGRLRQELMQRLNELQLLKRELDQRNLELRAANAELRLMNEIKASFVSVAAHELRTPLTSIYGYLELFLDGILGPVSEKQQEYLQRIYKSAGWMLAAVSNLLDMIRIDSDRVELVLQPASFHEVLEGAVERFEPQLLAQEQQLQMEVPGDLPQILCDVLRTEQVLGRLLSQASTASPPGGTIRLSAALSEDGSFLQVSVADSAEEPAANSGPPPEGRFSHHGQAASENADTASLGLYVVRSLVELHGGEFQHTFRPGQGNVFHVSFPVAVTEHSH